MEEAEHIARWFLGEDIVEWDDEEVLMKLEDVLGEGQEKEEEEGVRSVVEIDD